MILVDTSVWIDHLRRPERELIRLLSDGDVLCHPFVVGELACGHLKRRVTFLAGLSRLPTAPLATHAEALAFVERHALSGRGIGWTDAHLLASATLAGASRLWTRDKRLRSVAQALDRHYQPEEPH